MSSAITLSRDCPAIQIPYGNSLTAREGTVVFMVHKLGDAYTVRTPQGYLMRIDTAHADALGETAEEAVVAAPTERTTPVEEAELWDVLRTCYDPEIPANIVDIGLIYTCTIDRRDDAGAHVAVVMTLTAPGCGMGQVLQDDVERKLGAVPGVASVKVDLVFDPPWDMSMMSESARLDLGMM
jgi:probable FeS assembly SUF system protein SufT